MDGSQTPHLRAFNCPSCGSNVTVRALGHTVTVVCQSCRTLIDAANENYKIILQSQSGSLIVPLIPLGQRGTLRGVLWEVIGFMQRCDGSETFEWQEYLLFNPMQGFRWLTFADGHWNFVKSTKTRPLGKGIDKKANVVFEGEEFKLFHRGTAKVKYVSGEFYWRVKVGDEVDVADYIAPPKILSNEKTKSEVIWSVGVYIQSDIVRSAFQIQETLPIASGIAPNQPSEYGNKLKVVRPYWMIFVGVLVTTQMIALMRFKNHEVYRGEFVYQPGDTEKTKVTPPFELNLSRANVQVELYSPVENNWLETQIDLVNDQTGETYEFEEGVEYYSGHDSDGFWSEGSQLTQQIISAVPSGIYHLNIEASGPPDRQYKYAILVTRGAPVWSDFILAFVLVSVYPIYLLLRRRSIELQRWSQSDYSPYQEHQD
ncbi:MAG TPA: DUF4178 domain-containing protein [Pseudobdellovibrionaceae bacterium]|nr:DUF4178 domain-containing protein [Pseudobdellovibrionaceae bacterium]